MKKTSLILVVLILMASCKCIKPAYDSKWFVGHWEGVGLQIDGKEWEIDLDVQKCGDILISYPDLECSGTWTILTEKKDVITLKEKIIEGTQNCDQGVDLVVTKKDKDTIEVLFYLDWYSDEPIAVSEMVRRVWSKSLEQEFGARVVSKRLDKTGDQLLSVSRRIVRKVRLSRSFVSRRRISGGIREWTSQGRL